MSQESAVLDAITGGGDTPSQFDHIDMSYRLRIRAYVGICMPPIFMSLNEHLKMMEMRKQGIAFIMFYLDFANGAAPIAFGRTLRTQHTVKLCRGITDANNQPVRSGTERLMVVSDSIISARARSHGHESLGFDDGSGAVVEAGRARILHILTKPMAPPAQRQVTVVPEGMRNLKEHAWDQPLPSIEGLSQPPDGYQRVDVGGWAERSDVWGMPNTDINQHVNVQEYIMGGENQFSRVLRGAGLPVERHRISRARLLFRKPFFPSQEYLIRSRLFRRDQFTQIQAGYYPLEGTTPSAKASTFVVFDGRIEV
ncbi:MAG TPA: hypothetical protein VGA88_09005 [Burkholderiales bacterium]